jgi:hypothetical protein
MNASNGPTRMMLVNCGKYTFADVDLTAPLHLVGPNNVGKTSLIALLQFLYLDDQRHMHFTRSMSETRTYYFPDPYSYVLFELMTPTGFQVLGVHGLGPLRQYQFERFSYTGRLDRADYVDAADQVMEPDQIRARLTDRGWTRLEPKHHRAALTGVGDARGIELGLVPVHSQRDYDGFRTLFCNILRLSHMKQDELKAQLLDLYKGDFKQPRIDLSAKYAEGLEQVRRDAHEVKELKQLETDIDNLLRHAEARGAARVALPALWMAIGEQYEAAKRELARQITSIADSLCKNEDEMTIAGTERDRIDAETRQCDQAVGVLRAELAELARERKGLADYIPEWVEERLRAILAELAGIAGDLDRASQDDPARVARRLEQLRTHAADLRQRIDGSRHALVAALRDSLGDEELQRLFAVVNPALLGVSLDALTLSADDAIALAQDLLRAHESEGVWSIGSQHIAIPADLAPSLDQWYDVPTMEAELDDLECQIEANQRALDAAHRAGELRAAREELLKEQEVLNKRRFSWGQLQEKEKQAPQWTDELAQGEAHREALGQALRDNEATRVRLGEQSRQLEARRQRCEKDGEALAERVRRLTPPADDWPHQATTIEGDIDDLITRYERESAEESREHERVCELLTTIHQRTYGRYETDDESQTIDQLRQQKESIPAREKSVEELWTGIATAVRKHLKDIHGDVDTLKARITELNRRLSAVGISNLKSLRLDVDERPRWMTLLKGAMRQEEMPLFAVGGDADDALREIGKLFSEHPCIELADLFDLHFEVETPDGKRSRYDHLDNIESNGTTITIKVLVNLMLLRQLLDTDTIRTPFYLDECTSLDEANLQAIVTESANLGFCAVLASPDAMAVAERLYFIREEEGRVNLDPRTSMVRLTHA